MKANKTVTTRNGNGNTSPIINRIPNDVLDAGDRSRLAASLSFSERIYKHAWVHCTVAERSAAGIAYIKGNFHRLKLRANNVEPEENEKVKLGDAARIIRELRAAEVSLGLDSHHTDEGMAAFLRAVECEC